MARSSLTKRHIAGNISANNEKLVNNFIFMRESFVFGALGVVVGALATFVALQGSTFVQNHVWETFSPRRPVDMISVPLSFAIPHVKTHTLTQEEQAEFSDVEPEQTIEAKVSTLEEAPEEGSLVPDVHQILMEWMLSRGATFPNAEIVTYDAAADDRRVHATRNLEVGDNVFTIPDEFIITDSVARASPIGKLLEENLKDDALDCAHTHIAMFLLQERDLGSDSWWHPYIQILPTTYLNRPVNFGAEEVAMLEGSYAKVRYERELESLHENYDTLSKRVPFIAEKYSFEDYKWAYLSVQSRLFSLPQHGVKKPSMLPLGDMINHDDDREDTSWSYNDDLNAATFNIIKPVSKGSEFFVSYGGKGNENLLSAYGFALPNNKYNEAAIYIDLPSRDPFFEKKLNLMHNPSAEFYRLSFKMTTSPDHPLFQDALKMCRLIVATKEDLQFLPKGGDHLPFSIENEEKALLLLQRETEDALLAFPNTAEVDEKLLEDDSLSFNQRNIILTRLGEKEVLLKIIDFVELVIPLLHMDDIKEFNKARLNVQFKEARIYLRQVAGIYLQRAILNQTSH